MNYITSILNIILINLIMVVLVSTKILILNFFIEFFLFNSSFICLYKLIIMYWLSLHIYMLLIGIILSVAYYIYNYLK